MKEQHMLSEVAENSNPIQESESGREKANESTAIEGQRNKSRVPTHRRANQNDA